MAVPVARDRHSPEPKGHSHRVVVRESPQAFLGLLETGPELSPIPGNANTTTAP